MMGYLCAAPISELASYHIDPNDSPAMRCDAM